MSNMGQKEDYLSNHETKVYLWKQKVEASHDHLHDVLELTLVML